MLEPKYRLAIGSLDGCLKEEEVCNVPCAMVPALKFEMGAIANISQIGSNWSFNSENERECFVNNELTCSAVNLPP